MSRINAEEIRNFSSHSFDQEENNSQTFFFLIKGAGPDGVEEIKRHAFFSKIDWNVSI